MKNVLIYLNTEAHFETVASFVNIALNNEFNVHLYSYYLDRARQKCLRSLFGDKIKFVNHSNYNKYDVIIFLTYYPDSFPKIKRLKNVIRTLKKTGRLSTTKIYLVCHDYYKFDGFQISGEKQCIKLLFDNNEELICSEDHLLLTDDGWKQVKDIETDNLIQ